MSFLFFLLQSEHHVPANTLWLSERETAIADQLKFPKRRQEWRLGRWTAKHALHAFFQTVEKPEDALQELTAVESVTAEELAVYEILPTGTGAPAAFRLGGQAPVAISLSHRAGLAMCLIGPPGTAIGCDLELIEPRSPEFIADYFTPAETSSIISLSEPNRSQTATLIWSAKESALKCLQQGLNLDTRSVEVTLSNSESSPSEWQPFTVRECSTNQQFSGWWRQQGEFLVTICSAI